MAENITVNLALDAGGSKVIALLYDDDFRMISTHRTGSLRSNTTDPALAEQNIRTLLDSMDLSGCTIGTICGIADGVLIERIRAVCPVKQVISMGELELGMYAAELFGDGILALSGTGATIFARHAGALHIGGGYGAAVYDAGSGYWIGREAFRAVIEAYNGLGAPTLLTDLIAQKLGGTAETLGPSIFNIYHQNTVSPTAYVASCAALVSQAAASGDGIALNILNQAGQLMGLQTAALVRRNDLPHTLPIAVSGSVWRSHSVFLNAFRSVLAEADLRTDVYIPAFEPIVGAVIGHADRCGIRFTGEAREQLARDYHVHTFPAPKDIHA